MPVTKTELAAELKRRRFELADAIEEARSRGDAKTEADLHVLLREVDRQKAELAIRSAEEGLKPIADLTERIEQALAKAQKGAIGGAISGGIAAALNAGAAGPDDDDDAALTEEEDLSAAQDTVPVAPDRPGRTDVAAVDPEQLPSVSGAFTLGEAHLIALWRRSLLPIDTRPIIVFGIRGMLPVDFSGTPLAASHPVTFSGPDGRTMCCAIGQWRPGLGLSLFPGSTVPFEDVVRGGLSRRGEGVNRMGAGRYGHYRADWHKQSEGPAGHWALVQASPVTLQRTADDLDYDEDDEWFRGNVGDNIHCAFHMGSNGDIPKSRFSSAGCQVVAGTVTKGKLDSEAGPWAKFIAPFKRGAGGPSETEYVLFDGNEVRQMIATRYSGKTVILRHGSFGPLVQELQKRIAAALGRNISAEGDFGGETFDAVRAFQRAKFGNRAADGVVGPETAGALGLTLPLFDFEGAIAGGPGTAAPPAGNGMIAGQSGIPPAPALGGMVAAVAAAASELEVGIAWGAVTAAKHGGAFNAKVREIARRLACDPSHLMAVMAFETGESFAPDTPNKAGSGAIGLIQFMPATATDLGTSSAQLSAMSAIDQLDFVEKHIARQVHGRPLPSLPDLYMTVLLPSAIGKPDAHPLFRKPSKAYDQNKGLDRDKDGVITKAEAADRVQKMLLKGLKAANRG